MLKIILSILATTVVLTAAAQNIHRTACQGNIPRLDSLLRESAIDIEDDRGRSLLHWAVACQQKEVFDLLIEREIALNGMDNQDKTPLHVAVQFGRMEYIGYLIELQPNDEWQSLHGGSLLESAALNRDKNVLEKLIRSGVDVDQKNERGSTALEISRRIGADSISAFLVSNGADESLVRKFELSGKYMGQKAPGIEPVIFAPNFISTEEQEFGAVFNSAGTEFYFGVDVGKRNEIRYSKLENGKWTTPTTIISHERYSYNDPFLSNDESRLYFISDQALDGKGAAKDIDIWYVEKVGDAWSAPISAGSGINTNGDEYYISFTTDGTMYFASDGQPRPDTTRKDHDIYYSKHSNGVYQQPTRLSPAVNTKSYEADVFVSPDESYIIFCSTRDGGFGRGDLYISFKKPDGAWSEAVNMGDVINTEHYEYCPFVSKDGKYLFYTSNQDIYWVSTKIISNLKDSTR